jgi:hypothetical protein
MRTLVTFQSTSFNMTDAKANFINPTCFGDDVATWLITRLRSAGIETAPEPSQEDFGWYFDFKVPEGDHCLVLGHRPADGDEPAIWIGWLERRRGLLTSLFGGRNRNIATSACSAIHHALSGTPDISHVRWHTKDEFDRGREDAGALEP